MFGSLWLKISFQLNSNGVLCFVIMKISNHAKLEDAKKEKDYYIFHEPETICLFLRREQLRCLSVIREAFSKGTLCLTVSPLRAPAFRWLPLMNADSLNALRLFFNRLDLVTWLPVTQVTKTLNIIYQRRSLCQQKFYKAHCSSE